jgi:hypothetical protein
MEKPNFEKLHKRKDVIDMMTSMHSELSSMYKTRVLILDVLLIIITIILLTFVFADQLFLINFGINENSAKIILGLSSIFASFFSLLSYIIDWRGKKICHDQAFQALLGLKSEWRIYLLNEENIDFDSALKLEEKTDLILSQFIVIDDKVFNKLKKKHYMKVALSKAISNNPNLPLLLLKLQLVIDALMKGRKNKL